MDLDFWACVTTKDRTQDLDKCLAALWSSTRPPEGVVVSDDSRDPVVRQQDREVVERYPATIYLVGPGTGVCANRNHAVNAVPEAPPAMVAFIDDDICVDDSFIERGMVRYAHMSEEERRRTILTGVSRSDDGQQTSAARLSFRGYFRPAEVPESVAIHAAMFPRHLF